MLTDEATKILIVDDTPANLGVLFDFLADSGFTVLVAGDGESAIQKVAYAQPDLILLDVLMPGIDGFETCRRLKANESTRDIPIIFMTALSETVSKVEGLKLGAVDYITKPLEPPEFLARVQLHLSLRSLTKKLQEQNLHLEQEIKERKRSEEKISEQAALLNITRDAIIVQDLKNRVLFWNKGAERLYGWLAEEISNRNVNKILYGKNSVQLQDAQAIIAEKGEWEGELNQITKDNREITVASRWTLVRDQDENSQSILIVNTDITEKKQLEIQFLRTQRMESLGTLASGIAHDLNNVLAPILMAVQLLQIKLSDEQSHKWLNLVETNVNRGADLVKQVLSFTRGYEGERVSIQVGHLIGEIRQIVKETFPKSIEFHADVPVDLWTVSGDPTQLHQVLINFCVNARDAMSEGGILRISGENIYIDENFARMNIDAQVGNHILITVSDTGEGMPRSIMDRIFEPFFTTKEIGKGTGLGLSTAMGIVKSHCGFITVSSELGQGTTFKLYLPVIERVITNSKDKSECKFFKGQGELILVVDDEDSIREITKMSLEENAYKVIMASDGIEAITLYAKHKGEIQAVLIDMMMPTMDGLTTIRTLQKIDPNVKVIAVSGLMSTQQVTDAIGESVKTFLSKPYTSNELLKNLQVVLNSQ